MDSQEDVSKCFGTYHNPESPRCKEGCARNKECQHLYSLQREECRDHLTRLGFRNAEFFFPEPYLDLLRLARERRPDDETEQGKHLAWQIHRWVQEQRRDAERVREATERLQESLPKGKDRFPYEWMLDAGNKDLGGDARLHKELLQEAGIR